METYDKDQVKHIVDVLLDEFISDMANESRSFEEYDYGYLAGLRDFKSRMFTIMEGLEVEPA